MLSFRTSKHNKKVSSQGVGVNSCHYYSLRGEVQHPYSSHPRTFQPTLTHIQQSSLWAHVVSLLRKWMGLCHECVSCQHLRISHLRVLFTPFPGHVNFHRYFRTQLKGKFAHEVLDFLRKKKNAVLPCSHHSSWVGWLASYYVNIVIMRVHNFASHWGGKNKKHSTGFPWQ